MQGLCDLCTGNRDQLVLNIINKNVRMAEVSETFMTQVMLNTLSTPKRRNKTTLSESGARLTSS